MADGGVRFRLAGELPREALMAMREGTTVDACDARLSNAVAGASEWLVVVDGTRPEGWLLIEWNGKPSKPDHPDIADVFVREGARGRGLGTLLVLEAERRVRERGHSRVGLSVNPEENVAARRLYERLGYHHDGGEPYLDGVYDGVEDWVIDLVKDLG
ncbi:MAG TPA: GNAT family N-acetyltransferase [Acidimicrobiales bacterium]|nr:GNAT family N-acetyltransferase [Acidimicrobiales bacterium]